VTPFLTGQICLLSWFGNSIPCRLNKINQAYLGDNDFSPDKAAPQLMIVQELVYAAFTDTQRGGCFGRGHDVGIVLEHTRTPLKRLVATVCQQLKVALIDAAAKGTVGFRL
jgi:hypothetical protein